MQTSKPTLLSIALSTVVSIVYLITPTLVIADNFYGGTCGPQTCTATQTCQKTYRGVLPVQELPLNETNPADITDIEVTYTCVDPPIVGAPNSIYKGPQSNDGYNSSVPRPQDDGVPVNIINQGPVPVDIFNPLPLPTNIVSPNPLPVVVVDDLALYQQKELIDAKLAEAQKVATVATVANEVRNRVSEEGLAPPNVYTTLYGQAVNGVFGPLGTFTAAEATYGGYASFDTREFDEISNEFSQKRETPVNFDSPTYNNYCEGSTQDASEQSLLCTTLAFLPENNPNSISKNIELTAEAQVELGKELVGLEYQAGSGYLGVTLNGEPVISRDPFTSQITTQGSTIANLVKSALIDTNLARSIQAEQCFASVPSTILDGTIDPIFEGLFGESENNEEPFSQLGDELLGTLTSSISCEANSQLGSLFDELNNEINQALDDFLADTGIDVNVNVDPPTIEI